VSCFRLGVACLICLSACGTSNPPMPHAERDTSPPLAAPLTQPIPATVPKPAPAQAAGAGTEYDGVVIAPDATTTASPVLPATVHIDMHHVLRPLSTDLLGVTLGGRETENILYGAGEALADDARAMLPRLPLHLVRIAQYNNPLGREVGWKQAVGPVAQRPAVRFTSWDKPAANRAGPAEVIAAILAADPQARFVWTVDIENDDPDDAADLAEYLTGGNGNPRGGTDWAALRRADGLANPVPIVLWELGNETDWRKPESRLDANAYVERCRRAITAIRSAQPQAQFAPHVTTAPWASQERYHEDWRNFHRTVLRELGPDIAHLAFHPYYFGFPTSVIEGYMDVIRDDVRTITGSDRITLYVSEHGLWPNAPEGQRWETSWWKTHGLPGCLATSQFLNRAANRTDVGPVTYHSLSCGPWGVVYRGKESGHLWSTGISDLFALYRDHLGDAVLATTLEGEQTDPHREDCSLTVLVSRMPDGVALIATNRSASRRPLRLDGWQMISGSVLRGDSPEARNSEQRQEIHVKPLIPGGPIELPERSVTACILKNR
jgi:hypothetical protein